MTRNSQCVCASLARHKNRQLVSILGLSVPLSHTKHMWPHNGVPKPVPNTAALPSITVCDWLTAKHNNQSANIYQFYLAKAKSSDFSTHVESSHRSAKDKIVNDPSFSKLTHHFAWPWVFGPMMSENNLKH